jgi:hypothetical protein
VAEDMDFVEADRLFQYWLKYPPQHLLLRAYVGYEGPDERALRPEMIRAAQNFGQFAKKQGGGIMTEAQLPDHMKTFLKDYRGGKFDKVLGGPAN